MGMAERIFLSIVLFTLLASFESSSFAKPSYAVDLMSILSEVQVEEGGFERIEDEELAAVESAFLDLLLSGDLLQERWSQIGMSGEAMLIGGRRCVFLCESPGDERGRGVFLLFVDALAQGNGGQGMNVFLQAPHSFFDRKTGQIVSLLLEEGKFMGGAWNSSPRYAVDGDYKGPADTQAHSWNYFTAFARAFAQARELAFPRSRIVQIHGFAPSKRSSSKARRASAIISAGTLEPSRQLLPLGLWMKLKFPPWVLLFPREVSELGALQNTTGKALRAFGQGDAFVHIELSWKLRRSLLKDRDRRAAFAKSLATFLR